MMRANGWTVAAAVLLSLPTLAVAQSAGVPNADASAAAAPQASRDAVEPADPPLPDLTPAAPAAGSDDAASNAEATADPSSEAAAPELSAALARLRELRSARRPSPDDVATAMAAVREAASPVTEDVAATLLDAACWVATRTKATSAAYVQAFRWLRARDSADAWPCSPTQTDRLWRRFFQHWQRRVPIRHDLEGAYDYLHQWHDVVSRFEAMARDTRARGAATTLGRMRSKVERAIGKLPRQERCADLERIEASCGFECDRRAAPWQSKCKARKTEKARDACVTKVATKREACMSCCKEGGRGCRSKSKLVCAEVATNP